MIVKIYTAVSDIDIHLTIDSDDRLRTKPYDKRNDFNFQLWTFHLQYMQKTFQQQLHMEYIAQLILYSFRLPPSSLLLERFVLLNL